MPQIKPAVYCLLLALFVIGSCSCVRIVNFNVPQYSSLKSDVTLTCEFEMTEGPEERLHSVKWYRFSNSKHMEEFYSWKPKRQPPATRHHIHAVRIDMRHSNHKQVLLKRVGLNTSGTYRCEVTTKNLRKPGFDSQYDDGSLTVLEIPEKHEGPVITGGRASYQFGDQLSLNCTSPRTYPPTVLRWYINDQEQEAHSLPYPMKKGSKHGLFKSTIGLNMPIRHELFKYGRIRIRCVGEIRDGNFARAVTPSLNSRDITALHIPEKWQREWRADFLVSVASSAASQFSSLPLQLLTMVAILVCSHWSARTTASSSQKLQQQLDFHSSEFEHTTGVLSQLIVPDKGNDTCDSTTHSFQSRTELSSSK